jgi:hypothetical protein
MPRSLNPKRRVFSKLAAAVKFLAKVISAKDYETLARACREKLPQDWVLERLEDQHNATPLPQLYAGWEFPTDSRAFKLGGHAKELGFIHIDFVKSRTGWEFKKIWMCR